jgi:hypothetical protein
MSTTKIEEKVPFRPSLGSPETLTPPPPWRDLRLCIRLTSRAASAISTSAAHSAAQNALVCITEALVCLHALHAAHNSTMLRLLEAAHLGNEVPMLRDGDTDPKLTGFIFGGCMLNDDPATSCSRLDSRAMPRCSPPLPPLIVVRPLPPAQEEHTSRLVRMGWRMGGVCVSVSTGELSA